LLGKTNIFSKFLKESHGIKQPKWVLDNYHTIMHLKDKTFFVDFLNMEMAKLISGNLYAEILDNIKDKVNGSTYEAFLYGAVSVLLSKFLLSCSLQKFKIYYFSQMFLE
jgi:hypothetical protein